MLCVVMLLKTNAFGYVSKNKEFKCNMLNLHGMSFKTAKFFLRNVICFERDQFIHSKHGIEHDFTPVSLATFKNDVP